MTNRVFILCLGVLACLPAGASGAAEGPTLTGEKVVLPAGDVAVRLVARRRTPFTFRLSPDGTRVLYARVSGGVKDLDLPAGQPGERVADELVVREIASGKEVVMDARPGPGIVDVHTRFGPFDPKGQWLALTTQTGALLDQGGKNMEVLLCEVATGRAEATGIVAGMVMARFDRTGERLLVSKQVETSLVGRADLKAAKPLALRGFVQSVCPTADVVCGFVPPARQPPPPPAAPGVPPARPKRPPPRLVLFDYATDKEIAELPVHEANSALDDVETQWTADGRYLLYVDNDGPDAARGTRVWDRTAGEAIAFIPGRTPVGPGPTPSTMVLNASDEKTGRAATLYDAATGAASPFGDGQIDVVHAAGGTVLYLAGEGEQAELRAAAIGLPEAAQPK